MKIRCIILMSLAIVLGLSVTFIFVTAFAHANPSSSEEGGFSKGVQRSASSGDQLPLRFPSGNWPWYAQEEIFLHPEPPIPGSPAEICAVVVNEDAVAPHAALLQFGIAPLGIGVTYNSVGTREIIVPPGDRAIGCVMWMNPEPGRWGIEVLLLQEGAQEPFRSLRNIDLWEPLVPGASHDLIFQVGPLIGSEGTITFTLTSLQPGWQFTLNPSEIHITDPFKVYTVTLSTTPPRGVPLGSRMPVVDVEGFLNDQPIGGFRKFDSPAVPLHVAADPVYAEREISVDPYPPRAGEPTQICVELRNPTDVAQDVSVQFSWASFGIGLPFTPINGPLQVHLPAHSIVKQCINWVPPIAGHLCFQVMLEAEGYAPQRSQRNIDVNEPLQAGVSDTLIFPVGNPFQQPVTITLGMIPHLPDWTFDLSPSVLPNMQSCQVSLVTLTVTPPAGQPLPADNTQIVDIEAYADGQLIGGFRKIFRPPVPIHISQDPIYAEREISVDPYPPRAGEPTEICVELRNPTDAAQDVEVQFSWASFGIGLPFTPINGPLQVHLPPHSVVKQCISWVPPVAGHLCFQVMLEAAR